MIGDDIVDMQRRLGIALLALEDIASFYDKGAQEYFNKTGSFGAFDEPGPVEVARTALVKMELGSFGEDVQ